MKFILGKKLDMTQVWRGDEVVAVTRVQVGPCTVVQVKDREKDGYEAVVVGFGERKEKNIKKPQKGHFAKCKAQNTKCKVNFRYLREFRLAPSMPKDAKERQEMNLKSGDVVNVGTFEVGDIIKVTGVSKGKGFQGVVRRHGFSGAPASHGTKDQLRMPGSIGATGPAHVFKGKKMPGRMGGERTTTTNLEIVEVDKENNILLIKGAVPGARNGLLLISGEGELKVVAPSTPKDAKDTPEQEDVKAQKSPSAEAMEDKHESTKTRKQEDVSVETQNFASGDETEEKKDPSSAKATADKEDIEEVVVEAKEKVDKRTIEGKKQPNDLSYKDLLKKNKGNKQNETEENNTKKDFLTQEGYVLERRDKSWCDGELLVFTLENITNHTLESIKEASKKYKGNK